MKLKILDGIMTTDHPESSYGLPVLVLDGTAYGPGDRIDGREVGDLIVEAGAAGLPNSQKDFVKKFLSQSPRRMEWWPMIDAAPNKKPGPVPTVKGEVKIQGRVPSALADAIDAMAKAENKTRSEIIRAALEKYTNEY